MLPHVCIFQIIARSPSLDMKCRLVISFHRGDRWHLLQVLFWKKAIKVSGQAPGWRRLTGRCDGDRTPSVLCCDFRWQCVTGVKGEGCPQQAVTVQLPRDSLDASWNPNQEQIGFPYDGKIQRKFDFYLECAAQKVNVKSLIYGVPWTSATAQAQRSNAGNYYAVLLSTATLENLLTRKPGQ